MKRISIDEATTAVRNILSTAYTGDPHERYDNAMLVARFLEQTRVIQRQPYNHKSEKGY